MMAEIRLLKK